MAAKEEIRINLNGQWILVFMVVSALAALALRAQAAVRAKAERKAKRIEKRDHEKIAACIMAEEFVTAKLKAPSTAKSPGMFDQDEYQATSLRRGSIRKIASA